MVKGVTGKTHIENFNVQNKPKKEENDITKLFHSIVKALGIESWFQHKPVSNRNIEVLPKDDDEIQLEDLFGPKEEAPEVHLVIANEAVQHEFIEPTNAQKIATIEEEIGVLENRSAELKNLIVDEEASIIGKVERAFGMDKLSILKEDKKIIDDLIASKNVKLIQLIDSERGDLDGLEFDEHSDYDEISL